MPKSVTINVYIQPIRCFQFPARTFADYLALQKQKPICRPNLERDAFKVECTSLKLS